jgi:NitT/TauT family transport system substrate-binding protein
MPLMRGLCRLAASLAAALFSHACLAADTVTLGTDWRAQAEHGGYYQAVATGLYAKAGLEVIIRQGGPQVNHSQLLAAGRLDFSAVPNSFIPLNFAQQNVPVVAVAAIFQKDPAVLISHAGQGNDHLGDLKGKKIMISPDTRIGFWRFLKSKYGYSDNQIAPYTFNLAPFLSDPSAIQQGLLSSEPFQIERAGKKPVVMLLADAGYASYSSVIMTSRERTEKQADLVQRFVDASIAGWISYLTGDASPANALIKKDNPDMTDELLAFGRGKLIEHGMILSGDAQAQGVGIMSDARWRAFFDVMAADGLYPRTMDFRKAYTTAFVGKPQHRAGGSK